jgi:hypothetical protein
MKAACLTVKQYASEQNRDAPVFTQCNEVITDTLSKCNEDGTCSYETATDRDAACSNDFSQCDSADYVKDKGIMH